jgi:DNA-binding response OmpR family regulator
MPKILLVEDDARVASFIKRGLEAEGHVVDAAATVEDALGLARLAAYPLVVLDRMLPDGDGLEVCRALRRNRFAGAILMLTAKDVIQDRVDGLQAGADDYLVKPFAFDELIARVDALLRRAEKPLAAAVLRVGDLILDRDSKRVRRGDRDIALTAKEFALLSYLMSSPGVVLSRARLLDNVWNVNHDPGTKVVDVYVRYLRRKIDAAGEPPMIQTVRGFGYAIADPMVPKQGKPEHG